MSTYTMTAWALIGLLSIIGLNMLLVYYLHKKYNFVEPPTFIVICIVEIITLLFIMGA